MSAAYFILCVLLQVIIGVQCTPFLTLNSGECKPYNDLKQYHGVCNDIMKDRTIRTSLLPTGTSVSYLNKEWNKVKKQSDKIRKLISAGKEDIPFLKVILTNYFQIYFELDLELPPDNEFKKLIETVLKPSYQTCLHKIKETLCHHYFPSCNDKTNSCITDCERVKRNECKEQVGVFTIMRKIDKSYTVDCTRVCSIKY